jgi:hypothetical protein
LAPDWTVEQRSPAEGRCIHHPHSWIHPMAEPLCCCLALFLAPSDLPGDWTPPWPRRIKLLQPAAEEGCTQLHMFPPRRVPGLRTTSASQSSWRYAQRQACMLSQVTHTKCVRRLRDKKCVPPGSVSRLLKPSALMCTSQRVESQSVDVTLVEAMDAPESRVQNPGCPGLGPTRRLAIQPSHP